MLNLFPWGGVTLQFRHLRLFGVHDVPTLGGWVGAPGLCVFPGGGGWLCLWAAARLVVETPFWRLGEPPGGGRRFLHRVTEGSLQSNAQGLLPAPAAASCGPKAHAPPPPPPSCPPPAGTALASAWLEDIVRYQAHKFLAGIAPIRSLLRVSSAAVQLLAIPVEHLFAEARGGSSILASDRAISAGFWVGMGGHGCAGGVAGGQRQAAEACRVLTLETGAGAGAGWGSRCCCHGCMMKACSASTHEASSSARYAAQPVACPGVAAGPIVQ